jgi:hypothetical protein
MTDNPFTSLNATEYELLMANMRAEAHAGAKEGVREHLVNSCAGHNARTQALEAAVFGRFEHGVLGIDNRLGIVESKLGTLVKLEADFDEVTQRMKAIGDTVDAWADDRKWFKRVLYGALVVATIGLIVTIAQSFAMGHI